MPDDPHYIPARRYARADVGIIMLALVSSDRFRGEFHVEPSVVVASPPRSACFIAKPSLGNFLGIVSAPAGFTESWCRRAFGTLAPPGRGWFRGVPAPLAIGRALARVLPESRRC